jgi:hypothetical protein
MNTPLPVPPPDAESAPLEPPTAVCVEPAPAESALEQKTSAALAAFHQEALAAPTALQKILGCRAADMLTFSNQLSRELRAEARLEGSLMTILEDSPIVLEKMIQLDRQAERFMHLLQGQQRATQAAHKATAPDAASPPPRAPR